MINGEMLKNMTTEEQFGFLCEDGVVYHLKMIEFIFILIGLRMDFRVLDC